MSALRHAHPIVKRVQKHFGKKLRFVFRNFPLAEMHPHAQSAAETAEYAGAHGKFWEMHDGLFQNRWCAVLETCRAVGALAREVASRGRERRVPF